MFHETDEAEWTRSLSYFLLEFASVDIQAWNEWCWPAA